MKKLIILFMASLFLFVAGCSSNEGASTMEQHIRNW